MPKTLENKWSKKLRRKKNPIIGLNWKGNRKDSEKIDRNIPPKLFERVTSSIDADFISLQRGAEPETTSGWIRNDHGQLQAEIHRIADSNSSDQFLEYAAIIANCDLIITPGTTVAHLAAAMGKPTWILLQKNPEWRWGLDGSTTFWYPSARLFRQQKQGDWEEVLEQVKQSLIKQLERPSAETDPPGILQRAKALARTFAEIRQRIK